MTASRSFSLFLGDFVRTLGHAPSRADPGTWMKKDEGREVCSRLSTHVEDFLTIGTSPKITMRKFEETFLIRTQEIDPGACLGSQWEANEKGKRKVHSESCAKEATKQLESRLGQEIRK